MLNVPRNKYRRMLWSWLRRHGFHIYKLSTTRREFKLVRPYYHTGDPYEYQPTTDKE